MGEFVPSEHLPTCINAPAHWQLVIGCVSSLVTIMELRNNGKVEFKEFIPYKKKLVRTNLRYFTNVFIYQNIVMFYLKKID